MRGSYQALGMRYDKDVLAQHNLALLKELLAHPPMGSKMGFLRILFK